MKIGAAMAALAAFAAVVFLADRAPPSERRPYAFSPGALLAPPAGEPAPATEGWNFRFPEDHGAHPQYPTEAWRLAGVLTDDEDRRLGMQLSVLRLGLAAREGQPESRWAATEIYAGMLTLTDPDSAGLLVGDRASRSALGLAGTSAEPVAIWVEDWRLEEITADTPALGLRGELAAGDVSLDIRFLGRGPLVESGELRDASAAGSPPFVFYVQPGMQAEATLRVGDREKALEGPFVLEHAWGELPLPGSPVAQDRFTLFLDDGRTLSLLRSHRVDGSGTPRTSGLLFDPEAAATLPSGAVELTPLKWWTSGQTGARYPIHWRLSIPDHGISLRVVPEEADQEGTWWSPFWAGPVRLEGEAASPSGKGIMALNGYPGTKE